MLLALQYHRMNLQLKGASTGDVPDQPAEQVRFTNPLLASAGRLMCRLVPFLLVMVL